MHVLKKILFGLIIIIGVIITAAAIYINHTLPKLPENTDTIIEAVMQNPLPEKVNGRQAYAQSGDVALWYEVIEPELPAKATLLLMMGISNDALGWPPQFLQALRGAGYRVIRYDYRGTGMSDWMQNWDHKNPYSLQDMTRDARAILDAEQIEKVHLLGISLGGMVAQQMAIDYPDRVDTLVSMMSSCDIMDEKLPSISMDVVKQFIFAQLKYGLLTTEKNTIKLHLTSRAILRGNATYDLDTKSLAESVLYNLRSRKGYNPQVSAQHNAAVMTSASRYDSLSTLNIPTLIIHGNQDPFIPLAHGIQCAHKIPGAELLQVEGMGHDLPSQFIPLITDKLVMFFNARER